MVQDRSQLQSCLQHHSAWAAHLQSLRKLWEGLSAVTKSLVSPFPTLQTWESALKRNCTVKNQLQQIIPHSMSGADVRFQNRCLMLGWAPSSRPHGTHPSAGPGCRRDEGIPLGNAAAGLRHGLHPSGWRDHFSWAFLALKPP